MFLIFSCLMLVTCFARNFLPQKVKKAMLNKAENRFRQIKRVEFTTQYMQSHCGRIPSILEWFLPSWNKSFQDGRNPSGFVPEFGYDGHPQNSSSIFVNVIWKIFFPISFYCRDILHLPWSDSLVWKESFQTGRNPSRLEWILPV